MKTSNAQHRTSDLESAELDVGCRMLDVRR
jgi:hypothetical protein